MKNRLHKSVFHSLCIMPNITTATDLTPSAPQSESAQTASHDKRKSSCHPKAWHPNVPYCRPHPQHRPDIRHCRKAASNCSFTIPHLPSAVFPFFNGLCVLLYTNRSQNSSVLTGFVNVHSFAAFQSFKPYKCNRFSGYPLFFCQSACNFRHNGVK